MALHEKAWSGLNVLVFGKTPLLPMKLEQSIAAAAPAIETRIDSFENYDDAFDHCKAAKSVGLIVMTENCGELPIEHVFRQLGTHYEAKGVPCFGTLLYEKEKSFLGYQALQKNDRILSYLPTTALLNPADTPSTLMELWSSYSKSFEETLAPNKLKETLISLASTNIGADSIEFMRRTTTLLTSNLNLSWLEIIALKWVHVVDELKANQSQALHPNRGLVELARMAEFDHREGGDLVQIAQKKNSLCSRTAQTIHTLNKARLDGTLSNLLAWSSTQAKPGSPAIIRQISQNKSNIQKFASECGQASLERHLG